MNLLQLVQSANRRAKDPIVSNLFSTSDSQAVEYLGYVEQVANEIYSAHDWSLLRTDYCFTTQIPKTDIYPLPADFGSLLVYHIYNITDNRKIGNENSEEALNYKASGQTSQTSIRFRLNGSSVKFTLPIESDKDLILSYKSDYYFTNIVETVETPSDEPLGNDSLFILDDELMILGILYRRSLMNEFSDLQIRKQDYTTKLAELIDNDGGKRVSNVYGGERQFNKTTDANWNRYEN